MEELNLCELLKNCVGMTLYSTILGESEVVSISDEFVAIQAGKTYYCAIIYKDGRFYKDEYGECTLFPSKENRDWSKFIKPLKKDSIVMASKKEMSIFFH